MDQIVNHAPAGLPDSSLPALKAELERFRERIFADPVADYLIEYAAPRELFEFLKLGPADLTDEEEWNRVLTRYRALFEATLLAAKWIGEWIEKA